MKILEKIFPCLFRKKAQKFLEPEIIPFTDEEMELVALFSREVSMELKFYAQQRLAYQISRGYVTHDFVGDAVIPLNDLGWKDVTELLAYGYRFPENAYEGFLGSENHRGAVMDGTLTHIGVAIEWPYYVVLLARI